MDTAKPPTITDFLLARIAEDEAAAKAANVNRRGQEYEPRAWWGFAGDVLASERDTNEAQDDYIYRFEPSRTLAECVAKRAIVEAHPATGTDDYLNCENCLHEGDRDGYPDEWTQQQYPCKTLRALAAVYAGHSDYRPEWAAD